jgi:predicted nucleic acid-binding protein
MWNMDEPTLLTAARLKAVHRISLANAIIAAFAIRQNALLLHKDPEFESLSGQVLLEALPYKRA